MPSHSHSHSHGHAKAALQQRHPLALTVTADGGHNNNSNNNHGERFEWSRSTILGFIEDYRRQRVLWDPNTKGYHIKQIKYEALKQLGLKYGAEIRSIRSKIKSLRSSFHREHGKVMNGQRRGIHYQPMWFAYEAIHFILDGEQPQPQQQPQLHSKPQSPTQLQQTQQQQRQRNCRLTKESVENAAQRDTSAIDVVGSGACGGGDGDSAVVGALPVGEERAADGGVNVAFVDIKAKLKPNAVATRGNKSPVGRELVQMLKRRYSFTARSGGNNNVYFPGAASAANTVDDDDDDDGDADNDDDDDDDDEQHVVLKRADSDAELQHFGNIISAEDVKTELIESDSPTDLTPNAAPFVGSRKRRRTAQSNCCSLLLPGSNNRPAAASAVNGIETTTTATTAACLHSCNNNNNSGHSNGGAGDDVDEYGVFGEYVAITIRKLKTAKAKIVVKHLINNLLYEAELGNYDCGIAASTEPPQLYKT